MQEDSCEQGALPFPSVEIQLASTGENSPPEGVSTWPENCYLKFFDYQEYTSMEGTLRSWLVATGLTVIL